MSGRSNSRKANKSLSGNIGGTSRLLRTLILSICFLRVPGFFPFARESSAVGSVPVTSSGNTSTSSRERSRGRRDVPPPYDDPPPYHVAISMDSNAEEEQRSSQKISKPKSHPSTCCSTGRLNSNEQCGSKSKSPRGAFTL